MAVPPGQQRQRVCPRCSSLAVTFEGRCPWCGARYRRVLLPWLVLLALVQTAVVIGAVVLVLVTFGDTLDSELDDAVTDVQRDVNDQFDDLDTRVRRELRRELDARLPPTGTTAVP